MIGIVLLCLSGLWLSRLLIKREEEKVRCVSSLVHLMESAKTAVENYSMTASQILSSVGEDLIRACGYRASFLPKSFLEMSENCDIADEESRNAFCEFSRDFGKNYRSAQAKKCEECLTRLKIRESELAEQLIPKKRLIRSVCISLSLLAVILLL